MKPAVPPGMVTSPAVISYDRGWQALQSGDFRGAERELAAALKAAPDFSPAYAANGYLEIARQEPSRAVEYFDRALEMRQDDVSALVGRGRALLTLDRVADAVASFEGALAADPSLADLRVRTDVLRFRLREGEVASARDAARSGRFEEATTAYETAIARSPDSAFLYRELAAVQRQRGERTSALQSFRRAVELDPADAGSHVQIGDLLETDSDLNGALEAYGTALDLEPSPEVAAKRESILARLELARLPEEYRAIPEALQVTRADMAALFGIRLGPLLQAAAVQDTGVITDIRSNWAEAWIMAVARARVMEPFANHTFQPRAVLTRIDLAQAVTRLLPRLSGVPTSQVRTWLGTRTSFVDLSPNHRAYPSASAAVASGLMRADPDGRFVPGRPVTGAEAVATVDRIQVLAKVGPSGSDRR